MARSAPLALDTLVLAYPDVLEPQTKARLLRVFGELGHEPARRLIAHSLYSKQPVVRYEALQAAQMLLAYDRTRAEIGATLPADQRPSNRPPGKH